jgi:hypothetical protein
VDLNPLSLSFRERKMCFIVNVFFS